MTDDQERDEAKTLVIDVQPTGPFVEVCANVSLFLPARVGLIAIAERRNGWVELTPRQARDVANALLMAAVETEANPIEAAGGS